MRVDPVLCLRRGEHLIEKHGDGLPIPALKRALRVATQFRTRRVAQEDLPLGASRFGGNPDLPESLPWPSWDGSPDFQPAALSFLAQLNLAETPDGTGLLPDSGWLYFFYDAAQQPLGTPRSRGCARVFYVDATAGLQRTASPAGAKAFPTTRVTPSVEPTLPRWEQQLGLSLEGRASDVYWDLAEELVAGEEPHHRLFGWPKLVRGEKDQQCQLVTSEIRRASPGSYRSARTRVARPDMADFMLLLQLDTDDDGPGWISGDAGCLYFWIARQDLEERRFDNVSATLQSY